MKGFGKLIILTLSLLFFMLIPCLLFAEESCTVTPTRLSMNLISMPEAGDSIEFAVNAGSSCNGEIYYYFSYCPDYGTEKYGTGEESWINMSDGSSTPSFSTSSRTRYTFQNPGNYIVVAWTIPSPSIPETLPLIGCSVSIAEESGNGTVIHPSDFSGFWNVSFDGVPKGMLQGIQENDNFFTVGACDFQNRGARWYYKITGNQMTGTDDISYKYNMPYGSLKMTHTGTLENDTINGTWSTSNGYSGVFKCERLQISGPECTE